MLVPHGWGHATVNLAPSIGWASEVDLDRVYDDGLTRRHGTEWWRVGADEGGGEPGGPSEEGAFVDQDEQEVDAEFVDEML